MTEGDPLAGKREAINAGELEVLIWPDADQPPVKVGQVFKLRSCQIQITRSHRVGGKGKPWFWRATFARYYSNTRSDFLGPHGIVHDPRQAIRVQDDPDASTLEHRQANRETLERLGEPLEDKQEPPEPEAIPMHEVNQLPTAVAAKARYQALHLEDTEARVDRSMTSKLREVRIRAREVGVDVSAEMDLIALATEKARLKVRRAA